MLLRLMDTDHDCPITLQVADYIFSLYFVTESEQLKTGRMCVFPEDVCVYKYIY